ncbi:hypothetical protein NT6N_08720 [Oceaniferula spumae]|uniref:Transmembrane protein n=1 Tax=Oceaniferula spumae TaxID=2979115 RepID=A0AAT9FIQ5_9BACT
MDDPSHLVTPPESPSSPGQIQPPNLPPQPPAGLPQYVVSDQDTEHLRMLSIGHYILAGITALFACFPIIHLFMGAAMMTGGFGGSSVPAHEKQMMQMMGGIFVGIASLIILSGWALAVMNFVVARRIVRRESRTLCMVVSGINCLNMPLGTVLGVFTFVVLGRPQVAKSFDDHS